MAWIMTVENPDFKYLSYFCTAERIFQQILAQIEVAIENLLLYTIHEYLKNSKNNGHIHTTQFFSPLYMNLNPCDSIIQVGRWRKTSWGGSDRPKVAIISFRDWCMSFKIVNVQVITISKSHFLPGMLALSTTII